MKNKQFIRAILKTHIFFIAIFISVILIEIVIPGKNIWILLELEFYKSILTNPILWIFYAFGLLMAIGYTLISSTKKN